MSSATKHKDDAAPRCFEASYRDASAAARSRSEHGSCKGAGQRELGAQGFEGFRYVLKKVG